MFPKTVNQVATALQHVFLRVADDAAQASGFVQRQSKLTGNVFVQALTFGWLHNPQATLEELAQQAASLGVPITPQGLDQRFTLRAAECLRQVLEAAVTQALDTDPVAIPLLERFPGGVCLLDSTTLTLPDALAERFPGCGGTTQADGQAAVKLHVRWNLLQGALQGPWLYPGRTADQACDAPLDPLTPGTLRLADLGYFDLNTFRELSAQGVYWLTRVHPSTQVYDAVGQAWTLADFLRQHAGETLDMEVRLGTGQRLPCRLLAVRVPPHVAELRRQRLRRRQQRKGRKYRNADPWLLAEWTVLATNVSAEMLKLREACVLARCRWQVELLWKLWKSQGRIDESRSHKPERVLCEVYAKLLGMVVQHWVLLASCWAQPDRSLVKASQSVRRCGPMLALVLAQGHLVRRTLTHVKQSLRRTCRIAKRRRGPPTHQLLLGLPEAA